ncbi:hypothetical protein DSO57_1000745 [Entomophthora muscae]|uniref:Uncharacterized protein n=1 Tax=Entomophthora muscae TaxID=34485 RepID=A0ACC2T944_9FUNG|nr:hypothetical protein DSO57_1000745 [Entomophthora muscae]
MVTVKTAPESPANWNNATNSVEFDLEIHNEFPTSNNEPIDAMSAEDNVIDDLPQVNNVYNGEITDTLVEGISVEKLFAKTAVTISLADLLQESPKLRQKAHRAVLALQLYWKEELFLAGTGAPRTEAAVNKQMTHIILDGGAYKTLPNVFIAPSDVTFIMADRSKKLCLGIAKGLNLWISGAEIQFDTTIFDHHKYTLLLGQQTLTDLGITTQYIGNKWKIEYNNLKVQL